jgi:hypothetical protein
MAVYVFGVSFGPPGPWLAVGYALPADAPDLADLRRVPGAGVATGRLPRLEKTAVANVLVPVPLGRTPVPGTGWDRRGNLLVALAAPGIERIEYTGCYRGRVFTEGQDGDVLIRDVGPLDAPGRLEVLGGGAVVAAVDAGEPVLGQEVTVVRPGVEPVPVPAGTREVQRLRDQGEPAVSRPVAAAAAATLVARCRGPVPVEVVADGTRSLGRVPCDDQVHVLAERVALDSGQRLRVQGVPELRGGPPEAVSYEVLIVTAG